MIKHITARANIDRRQISPGLSIAQIHHEHLPDHLDPFLAFDHFAMAEPYFPPHPHAGFSAVTYMFATSKGGFVNRDSLHPNDSIAINPGDLHWTAAGSGVMHEEIPRVRGEVCDGLQIFVDLPAASKWSPPQILHQDAADTPLARGQGALVRIVVGAHDGVASPLAPPTPVTLLDVTLEPGGAFEHETPEGEDRFIYLLSGEAETGGALLRAGEAAGYARSGSRLAVKSAGGAHFIVAGGTPLRQPVVAGGPFVMTSREDIDRARRAFARGEMGALSRSF